MILSVENPKRESSLLHRKAATSKVPVDVAKGATVDVGMTSKDSIQVTGDHLQRTTALGSASCSAAVLSCRALRRAPSTARASARVAASGDDASSAKHFARNELAEPAPLVIRR